MYIAQLLIIRSVAVSIFTFKALSSSIREGGAMSVCSSMASKIAAHYMLPVDQV
jgi:hypothetical protein